MNALYRLMLFGVAFFGFMVFGIVVIGLTVYRMINWSDGWTENLHDILLGLVAFSTGINAIATGY